MIVPVVNEPIVYFAVNTRMSPRQIVDEKNGLIKVYQLYAVVLHGLAMTKLRVKLNGSEVMVSDSMEELLQEPLAKPAQAFLKMLHAFIIIEISEANESYSLSGLAKRFYQSKEES